MIEVWFTWLTASLRLIQTRQNKTPADCFLIACVAWRFWLGALNKGGRGQRNCENRHATLVFLSPATQRSEADFKYRKNNAMTIDVATNQ